MAVFDSHVSHSSFNGKDLMQNSRHRLLQMFRKVEALDSSWRILIMDDLTVKTVSYSLKKSEAHDQHDSDFENLYKIRRPCPSLSAIYFIQPTEENVNRFLLDMAGKSPLIRNYMNLEYLVIDSPGFVTHNEGALEELLGNEEYTCEDIASLNAMAARIATVFVSLKEFPLVRYRAAKSLDATTMTTLRDLVPTKLTAAVYDCLMKYKDTNPDFLPATETWELLILDRSVDQTAPVIHKWTYNAMCRDLLNMDGKNKTGGPLKKREFLLEDDPIWLELRHAHIGEVYERVHEKIYDCANTTLAQFESSPRGDTEVPIPKLFKLVKALPDYIERKEKLGHHAEIAGELYKIIMKFGLQELGQLDQDLVFGDAGIEDVIKYLESKDDTTREHKLRLLMIVTAIYPEVFEGETGYSLMKDGLLSSLIDFPKGPCIFVFIAGGATRSELRVCHKLTTKLKRQVVLRSSSLDDPATFITKLKLLKGHEDGADCWTSDLLIKHADDDIDGLREARKNICVRFLVSMRIASSNSLKRNKM